MRPLAPSPAWTLVTPLLQAHPTWARDEHEGRGIPTSLTPDAGCLAPSPLRAHPRARPIWAGARGDNLLVGPGTPRGRNADSTFYSLEIISMLVHMYVMNINKKDSYVLLELTIREF